MEHLDCLVIGGGPAGLAAAVQLARLRRSCVVIDDDAGRSLWSQVTRNYLGFPDGIAAADLRLLGQRQAVRHGVQLRRGRVRSLRRDRDGGFVATTERASETDELATPGLAVHRDRERAHGARLGERTTRGTQRTAARTVILATGVVDAFPAFEGRDACVGVSLFWCIVCDGYEAAGRHVAVFGDDDEAISTAFGLLHFTDRVTLVTRGRRRARHQRARLAELERRGAPVLPGPVTRYVHADGRIERLELGHGAAVACELVFVSSPKRPRTRLARRLGARADDNGYLIVDDAGRTTVPGAYAAGDILAGHAHQVSTGVASGATAATAVNYDLYDPIERGEG